MLILKFDTLPNTNSILLELSKKNAKSWTAVWTANQTKGRGYTGNQWVSEPEKNIALSFLIRSGLQYEELVFFNQWVCHGVCQYISRFSENVYVKWPNDVILNDKKICGILIETYKEKDSLNCIIGVGLNVNQKDFSLYPNASSLINELQKEFNLEKVVSDLLSDLKQSFSQIENKNWEEIFTQYNEKLYGRGEVSQFKKGKEIFEGIIKGVDEEGRLLVEKKENQSLYSFKNKEVEFIYPKK
ncbi:MAG: biotin--[acetyl-CoA-carboxylase] ligase [Weeksellaceae bacterium]|jgi:BirA family biotin operon repressor/biotin-[acetyl-CoA-carboxylase] ligase|nr:biotin--[acetyl-CoA-carboxylase] ligase [Weeksellaceae bacterium]MDX9704668.1 biotin--[acetyl-CoA-carboxylase] ligase [Weeksellaceae bacterium]